MSFTITLGWWVLPAIITVICLYMFGRPTKKQKYNGPAVGLGFSLLFDGLVGAFRILWFFPILIAWLIYFIFN